MDLSKAFDGIRHHLLIAKLHACGFSHEVLTLIISCLTNRQQGVKVDGSFSACGDLTLDVPQGLFLSPMIFHFLVKTQIFVIVLMTLQSMLVIRIYMTHKL